MFLSILCKIKFLNFFHTFLNILTVSFLKDFIYLFLERGREGEREEEKHQFVVASCARPSGDVAHNPGMCPDWESNWRPFGLQASAHPLSRTSQGFEQFLEVLHEPFLATLTLHCYNPKY